MIAIPILIVLGLLVVAWRMRCSHERNLAIAVFLGFLSFGAGSLSDELLTSSSRRETPLATWIVVGLYLGAGQFLLARKEGNVFRENLSLLFAMVAPIAAMVAVMFLAEPRQVMISGVPWLLAAGLGGLAGSLLAARGTGRVASGQEEESK